MSWLCVNHVGTLFLRDDRLNFRYAPAWLGRSNAVALSISLPLRKEPFDDQQSRPFFQACCPRASCAA